MRASSSRALRSSSAWAARRARSASSSAFCWAMRASSSSRALRSSSAWAARRARSASSASRDSFSAWAAAAARACSASAAFWRANSWADFKADCNFWSASSASLARLAVAAASASACSRRRRSSSAARRNFSRMSRASSDVGCSTGGGEGDSGTGRSSMKRETCAGSSGAVV